MRQTTSRTPQQPPTPQQEPDTTRRTQWTADLAIVTETHQAHGWPAGKLADATLEWTAGPLAGLKLIGFSVWARRAGGGHNVTFPARQYSVNGERRSFALLRPVMDVRSQETLCDAIIAAYLGTLTPYAQQAPGCDRRPTSQDDTPAQRHAREHAIGATLPTNEETRARAQAFPMLPLLAEDAPAPAPPDLREGNRDQRPDGPTPAPAIGYQHPDAPITSDAMPPAPQPYPTPAPAMRYGADDLGL